LDKLHKIVEVNLRRIDKELIFEIQPTQVVLRIQLTNLEARPVFFTKTEDHAVCVEYTLLYYTVAILVIELYSQLA
jgi:hypothetical protein